MVTGELQPTPAASHDDASAASLRRGPPSNESVQRPDPGLARGRYEAPSWAFMAVAAAALLGLAFVLGRAGWALCKRMRAAFEGGRSQGSGTAMAAALGKAALVGSKGALRRILFAMLLAVVVYGGFAVWRGLGKMGDELGRFRWWAFGAACALAFGNYLVRAT